MEGAAASRGVTHRSISAGGCVFSVATREDEPHLRDLLRSNSLGGWIQLALQREPDAFAAHFGIGHRHDFILARDSRTGAPVGLCERTVRDAFVNGHCVRLPYLGSLRVGSEFRNRIRILKNGFVAVRELLETEHDLPYSLTSITADNHTARRVLSAGVKGLPTYIPAGELTTFAIRAERARDVSQVEVASPEDLPAIAACLQRLYRNYQFAPLWRTEQLRHLAVIGALPCTSWLVIRRAGRIEACLALWDQTSVKQTLICGYSPWISRARPVYNAIAPLVGSPQLPPKGSELRQVYLSHLAVTDDNPDDFRALVRHGLSIARRNGFEIAVVGLATRHPLTRVLRSEWRTHEYVSLLHVVQWADSRTPWESDPDRIPHPEVALL